MNSDSERTERRAYIKPSRKIEERKTFKRFLTSLSHFQGQKRKGNRRAHISTSNSVSPYVPESNEVSHKFSWQWRPWTSLGTSPCPQVASLPWQWRRCLAGVVLALEAIWGGPGSNPVASMHFPSGFFVMVIEVIDDHGSGHDFQVEWVLELFIAFLSYLA